MSAGEEEDSAEVNKVEEEAATGAETGTETEAAIGKETGELSVVMAIWWWKFKK